MSRTIVFYLNILFFILGVAFCGLGGYVWTQPVVTDWGEHGKAVAIGLIVFGLVIVVLSTLAMCGSKKHHRHKCAIGTYSTFMFLLVAGQIAVVVYCLLNSKNVEPWLSKSWYNMSDSDRDQLMKDLKCGAYHPGETDSSGTVAPVKCTDDPDTDQCFNDCYTMYKSKFLDINSVVVIVCIVVACVELVLLIASCCICCEPEQDDEKRKRKDPYKYTQANRYSNNAAFGV